MKWEVQQAWDKQNNFLKAQARAQSELRSLIKQYDEMLHRDWEIATEEQKARVELVKAQTMKINDSEESGEVQNDGFLEALKETARNDWEDEINEKN